MKFIEEQPAYKLLRPYLPGDHSGQITVEHYVRKFCRGAAGTTRILDLGCGAGDSIDLFREVCPAAKWHGVDIDSSPEVLSRRREDGNFKTYNGVNLPYENGYFDLVYSRQVFEHVRYPDTLMGDIYRVLRPDGMFIGSVSYLEPYHSYSIFNFTPYGVTCVCEAAGLEITEMRPSIDSFTLIARQLLNKPRLFNIFFKVSSPLNMLLGLAARLMGLGRQEENFLKIQFTGQVCFLARKPA